MRIVINACILCYPMYLKFHHAFIILHTSIAQTDNNKYEILFVKWSYTHSFCVLTHTQFFSDFIRFTNAKCINFVMCHTQKTVLNYILSFCELNKPTRHKFSLVMLWRKLLSFKCIDLQRNFNKYFLFWLDFLFVIGFTINVLCSAQFDHKRVWRDKGRKVAYTTSDIE